MVRSRNVSLITVLFISLALFLWLSACAPSKKGKPSEKICKPDIEWQVTPEAKVTQLNCALGTHKKKPSLIFTVGIKNVSSKPLRYRLNIFLMDLDKGAGHLIPRKGKPPVLQPGKTATVKVPFIKTTDLPENVLVVVKTVGY